MAYPDLHQPEISEYQVGILCALPLESSAVMAALDEEYEAPEGIVSHDDNSSSHTFGRIGKHKVVLACLPAGTTGEAAAATVSTDLKRTFPRVIVGLMLGIGGGAPNKSHDIRLGDVVVARPTGDGGGVIQYDFGKQHSHGFKSTGTLDKPPAALRAALSTLQGRHGNLGGNKLAGHLSFILAKLQNTYSFPGKLNDRLFESAYLHISRDQGQDDSCTEGKFKCDPAYLKQRQPRTEPNVPRIFYGNIASADQVMRSGEVRDRVAKDCNAICFEMEAAGLENSFSCLVIRGICDYADSHKDKRWQGYAAASAASFAKEFLGFVKHHELVKERPITRGPVTARSTKIENQNDTQHLVPQRYQFPTDLPIGMQGMPDVGHFVPRDLEMKLLTAYFFPEHGRVSSRRDFVVHGMGGVGKTQLCLAFARESKARFKHIFWLDGSSKEAILGSLIQSASRILGLLTTRVFSTTQAAEILPPAVLPETHQIAAQFLTWLSRAHNRDWLLCIDKVDRDWRTGKDSQAYNYREYVPDTDHGNVLITTRLADMQLPLASLHLQNFNDDQALELLESTAGKKLSATHWKVERTTSSSCSGRCIPWTKSHVSKIAVRRLTYSPMSHFVRNHGGAELSDRHWSIQRYMEYYEETDSWARLAGIQYKISSQAVSGRSLLTTWKMSFDQVAQENETASGLLQLWSFLDHSKLWFELCTATSVWQYPVDFVWPNWYLSIAGDEIAFQESLHLLVSFSLVSISAREASYTMHPVLHDWSLHHVQKSASKNQLSAARDNVAYAYRHGISELKLQEILTQTNTPDAINLMIHSKLREYVEQRAAWRRRATSWIPILSKHVREDAMKVTTTRPRYHDRSWDDHTAEVMAGTLTMSQPDSDNELSLLQQRIQFELQRNGALMHVLSVIGLWDGSTERRNTDLDELRDNGYRSRLCSTFSSVTESLESDGSAQSTSSKSQDRASRHARASLPSEDQCWNASFYNEPGGPQCRVRSGTETSGMPDQVMIDDDSSVGSQNPDAWAKLSQNARRIESLGSDSDAVEQRDETRVHDSTSPTETYLRGKPGDNMDAPSGHVSDKHVQTSHGDDDAERIASLPAQPKLTSADVPSRAAEDERTTSQEEKEKKSSKKNYQDALVGTDQPCTALVKWRLFAYVKIEAGQIIGFICGTGSSSRDQSPTIGPGTVIQTAQSVRLAEEDQSAEYGFEHAQNETAAVIYGLLTPEATPEPCEIPWKGERWVENNDLETFVTELVSYSEVKALREEAKDDIGSEAGDSGDKSKVVVQSTWTHDRGNPQQILLGIVDGVHQSTSIGGGEEALSTDDQGNKSKPGKKDKVSFEETDESTDEGKDDGKKINSHGKGDKMKRLYKHAADAGYVEAVIQSRLNVWVLKEDFEAFTQEHERSSGRKPERKPKKTKEAEPSETGAELAPDDPEVSARIGKQRAEDSMPPKKVRHRERSNLITVLPTLSEEPKENHERNGVIRPRVAGTSNVEHIPRNRSSFYDSRIESTSTTLLPNMSYILPQTQSTYSFPSGMPPISQPHPEMPYPLPWYNRPPELAPHFQTTLPAALVGLARSSARGHPQAEVNTNRDHLSSRLNAMEQALEKTLEGMNKLFRRFDTRDRAPASTHPDNISATNHTQTQRRSFKSDRRRTYLSANEWHDVEEDRDPGASKTTGPYPRRFRGSRIKPRASLRSYHSSPSRHQPRDDRSIGVDAPEPPEPTPHGSQDRGHTPILAGSLSPGISPDFDKRFYTEEKRRVPASSMRAQNAGNSGSDSQGDSESSFDAEHMAISNLSEYERFFRYGGAASNQRESRIRTSLSDWNTKYRSGQSLATPENDSHLTDAQKREKRLDAIKRRTQQEATT